MLRQQHSFVFSSPCPYISLTSIVSIDKARLLGLLGSRYLCIKSKSHDDKGNWTSLGIDLSARLCLWTYYLLDSVSGAAFWINIIENSTVEDSHRLERYHDPAMRIEEGCLLWNPFPVLNRTHQIINWTSVIKCCNIYSGQAVGIAVPYGLPLAFLADFV